MSRPICIKELDPVFIKGWSTLTINLLWLGVLHDLNMQNVTQYNKRYILFTLEKNEMFALSNRRFYKLSNFQFTKFLYFVHYFVHHFRINLADEMYLLLNWVTNARPISSKCAKHSYAIPSASHCFHPVLLITWCLNQTKKRILYPHFAVTEIPSSYFIFN